MSSSWSDYISIGLHIENTFMDIVCARGTKEIYAVTRSGLLCLFNHNRGLEKWLDLKVRALLFWSDRRNYADFSCSNLCRFREHLQCLYLRNILHVLVKTELSGMNGCK